MIALAANGLAVLAQSVRSQETSDELGGQHTDGTTRDSAQAWEMKPTTRLSVSMSLKPDAVHMHYGCTNLAYCFMCVLGVRRRPH